MTDEVKQEGAPEKPWPFEKHPDRMTAKELREIALNIPEVTGVHAMKKAELLVTVKQHFDIQDEEPGKQAAAKGPRVALSVLELKQKIGALKALKQEARAAGESSRVNVLRKRINRLKKQTRRAARG